MPDNANCNFSHFSDCSFHVCRLYGVKFWDTRLYGCEFHSCRIEFTLFPDSTLANTHFRDCSFHSAAFLRSRMTRCNTVDCSVGRLNFNGARLDGCTYVTNAEAGHGLLRVGGAIVPFANEFPRTGALYQLWNTTPTDK